MKMLVFEKSALSAGKVLAGAQFAKGDPWQFAIKAKKDCILLLPGDSGGVLFAQLHWPTQVEQERVEPPAGFLGLEGDAVYLDENTPRKWWQKFF